MPSWSYTANIKQHLNQKGEADIVTIAENVAKELGNMPPWIFSGLPIQLVEQTKAATERVPEDKDYHELAFNRVLEQIYNRADDYRVWLGF